MGEPETGPFRVKTVWFILFLWLNGQYIPDSEDAREILNLSRIGTYEKSDCAVLSLVCISCSDLIRKWERQLRSKYHETKELAFTGAHY